MKMVAAGKKAWRTRRANLRTKGKNKGIVVAFRKDKKTGKTRPITKSIAQMRQKKVVKQGKRFKGIKPKKEKWAQKAKASGHVKEGALKKYKYDPNSASEMRRKALTACLNAEGFQVCRARIQMLVNLAPDGSRLDRVYKEDLAYLDGMKPERSARWKKLLKKASTSKPKPGYKVVGVYPSKSIKGKKYTVLEGPKGGLSCNCPRWIFKRRGEERTCAHVEAESVKKRKK